MAVPTTKCLDHIVHLTPPGSVVETTEQFRRLGLKVLPGGKHADGLTENALVVLADGVYIELISFVHPVSYYPPGSPEREERENHNWASKPLGWIDYAFLGNGSETTRISEIINARARSDGDDDLYRAESKGGRKRPDGEVLEWLISSPNSDLRGVLPFFCGDITPRDRRVPGDPPSNTEHPSAALGIAFIHLSSTPNSIHELARKFEYVVGVSAAAISSNEYQWELDTLNGGKKRPCRLILSAVPDDEGVSPISEVGFYVEREPAQRTITTPYAKISWIKI